MIELPLISVGEEAFSANILPRKPSLRFPHMFLVSLEPKKMSGFIETLSMSILNIMRRTAFFLPRKRLGIEVHHAGCSPSLTTVTNNSRKSHAELKTD